MADAAIDTRASGRPARTSETFTVKIVDDNSAVGSRPAVSGKKGELDGQVNPFIHFGGVTCVREQLKHLCGYVEQFDNLVQELTVEEMFMYTAELKLPTVRAYVLSVCVG